jgi:coatomer subunit gamma
VCVQLHFLATNLREDGGYEYKRAIVDTLMVFIAEIPDAREHAIACLCEFIEDCEFPELAVRILHLLGREGPATVAPSRCIRYIYNRVILENAVVRAAAVAALAKFGVRLDTLRPSIVVLLKRCGRAGGRLWGPTVRAEWLMSARPCGARCLNDNDDEVRDRATFYLSLLEKDLPLAKTYITAGACPAPVHPPPLS